METFCGLKELTENPYYYEQKKKALSGLTRDMIDMPIIDLINRFNNMSYCFTLQCCYGHFVYKGLEDIHNLKPLPSNSKNIDQIEYRIAYIAFCIENSKPGKLLFDSFKEITNIDPENIQFCCAEWFWERQINSYALQVEPDRFKDKDTAIINYKEALHIEKIRNIFFIRLNKLINNIA